eukprot:scaffold4955_cov83-Skeletonema_dohrnii-CCMP3373.AAC.1
MRPSPSVCASKCTECVNGAVSNGSFRGFTLDLNGGNYCKCHLDEGSTHNPGAGCTNGYNNFGYRKGEGEIIGVFGGDTVCYKFISRSKICQLVVLLAANSWSLKRICSQLILV